MILYIVNTYEMYVQYILDVFGSYDARIGVCTHYCEHTHAYTCIYMHTCYSPWFEEKSLTPDAVLHVSDSSSKGEREPCFAHTRDGKVSVFLLCIACL